MRKYSDSALKCIHYRVSADRLVNLRSRILLPDHPIESARFKGDGSGHDKHFAAFLSEREGMQTEGPIACASFYHEAYLGAPAWQLRGMATDKRYQGRGIGSNLLSWCEAELSHESHITLFWCNARVEAVDFYLKSGWELKSPVFEIVGFGPHQRMLKALAL